LFFKSWIKTATTGNIIHGFRASGIWPQNTAEIPASAYIGDRLDEFEASCSSK
jgi:hypothetical protein